MMPKTREDLILYYRRRRWAQHQVFFKHRHLQAEALFHRELVQAFWSTIPRLGVFAFRGGAKSTLIEEFIVLAVCEMRFRNIVILGASEGRAAERLAAIKRELERNDDLVELYGEQVGDTWTQIKLVTRNGICVQALGKDQDIRGLKHLDWRPDLLVIDDFEDRDNVATPEGRRKTFNWFMSDLIPACQPDCKIRLLATPMDPESVPMKLSTDPAWQWRNYPICRRNPETGVEEPMWPDLFPAEWIEETRRQYQRTGQAPIWDREFMCEAVSTGEQVFRAEDIRIEPRVRTWEPVYVTVDPARTTHRETSAMTGIVAWSWIGSKLVVWEDRTGFHQPDRIVDIIFEFNQKYRPVLVGVEADGLEQFLLQPIRQAGARLGEFLPLQPLRAPRGKLDFIRGLQPFLAAGELVFATEMPELRAQLLGFPRGRIDGPNALAYALTLRPGIPVYDSFDPNQHVADRVFWNRNEPVYLAMHATGAYTTAVMLQAAFGRTLIIGDWIREGDPAVSGPQVVREAAMFAKGRVEIVLHPQHFDDWRNVGLRQAIRALPADLGKGVDPARGRAHLRKELERMTKVAPAVQVASNARWTLAAISAGYAQKPGKNEPEPGIHRTLMEGLEATLGLLVLGLADDNANWSYTADGRRYRRYSSATVSGSSAPHRMRNPNYPLQ